MQIEPKALNTWKGKPYYPISQYFYKRFGERVGKVSVSVAESCPNRAASIEKGTASKACIFCDEWGSAAYHLERDRELREQIRHNSQLVKRRLKNRKMLVYFQSYTNTLDKITVLKERFEIALSEPEVHGIVVGTRPDCLPERIFPLLNEFSEKSYLLIELGTQSFFDHHLEFLRRGHSAQRSLDAVSLLAERTSADIGLHLIFGLPGETDQEIIESAKIINRLPVSNVKLHNLHVLRNTGLAELYRDNAFMPLSLEDYTERVTLFLRHLSPRIAVQRLTAICNRWEDLIAPEWTRHKMQPISYIENKMTANGWLQGDLHQA